MKRFAYFLSLALGLFVAAFAVQSCQKENLQMAQVTTPKTTAGDRAPLVYGVSVFRPGVPSQLITMDLGSGTVLNSVPVFVLDGNNSPVFLDDLKGVCLFGDQVWVTTGPNVSNLMSNLLIKVDPITGQGGIISHSTVGTVSDIDYDASTNTVYGLLNNNNRLVTINDNSNNWGTYNIVGNITNLGGTYVAKGLSMSRDNGGLRIIISATQALNGDAQVYSEPATAGPATLLSVITPALSLATANCGIGFQIATNTMLINRAPASGAGANSFAWANPLAANTASAFWGGQGWNFEDFTSAIQ